jgi:hypothetical protein
MRWIPNNNVVNKPYHCTGSYKDNVHSGVKLTDITPAGGGGNVETLLGVNDSAYVGEQTLTIAGDPCMYWADQNVYTNANPNYNSWNLVDNKCRNPNQS